MYRNNLRSIYKGWLKRQTNLPASPTKSYNSHINERWLKTPEIKAKMIEVKSKLRNVQKKNNYMLQKINESNKLKGILIDDELHCGLNKIMNDHSEEIQKKHSADSFHYLFWNQQVRNIAKHPNQRR